MGKPTASQRRQARGNIDVYPAETSLGWRVIRSVSIEKAAEKLMAGEWREVRDEHGQFVGCQIVATFKTDNELPSGASSSSITPRECELNAGLGGRSRTAGMPEDRRISRRRPGDGKPLPPEDAIERAIAKVREFAGSRIWDPIVVLKSELAAPVAWDAFPEYAKAANDEAQLEPA